MFYVSLEIDYCQASLLNDTIAHSMPAKKTNNNKPTNLKTNTASARVSSAKKSPAKKTRVVVENTNTNLRSGASSALGMMPRLSKRNAYILVAVLGLLLLLGVASRYMVVAWVDKKPITKFELYGNLDKRYGKDMREELIVEKLLDNEASKRNVKVSEAEINQEAKKIEDQQGGGDKLDQILQAQGISRDDFRKIVRLQLLRQKIFGQDVSVADDEVNKYIEDNKSSFVASDSSELKIDDKLKASVKDQLLQQKVNLAFNTWLNDALNGSRVVRY